MRRRKFKLRENSGVKSAAWGHAAYNKTFALAERCRPGALTGRVFQQAVLSCWGAMPLRCLRDLTAIGLLAPGLVFSATNSSGPDEIPPLHPPRAEIPPTFWEQYGQWILVGCIILLVAMAVAIWFFTRPRPPVIAPPEVTARKALAAMQGRPEDGAVLSAVSQVIRRYVAAAFGMAPGELTTTEFCLAVKNQAQVGPGLSGALAEFLRRCDERKFAPSPAGPALGAVARGFELIELAESRRALLRAAAEAPPPPIIESPLTT